LATVLVGIDSRIRPTPYPGIAPRLSARHGLPTRYWFGVATLSPS
jgi:hypothetical protein